MINVKNIKVAAIKKNGITERALRWLDSRPHDCLFTSHELAKAIKCTYRALKTDYLLPNKKKFYKGYYCHIILSGTPKVMWGNPKAVKIAVKELSQ